MVERKPHERRCVPSPRLDARSFILASRLRLPHAFRRHHDPDAALSRLSRGAAFLLGRPHLDLRGLCAVSHPLAPRLRADLGPNRPARRHPPRVQPRRARRGDLCGRRGPRLLVHCARAPGDRDRRGRGRGHGSDARARASRKPATGGLRGLSRQFERRRARAALRRVPRRIWPLADEAAFPHLSCAHASDRRARLHARDRLAAAPLRARASPAGGAGGDPYAIRLRRGGLFHRLGRGGAVSHARARLCEAAARGRQSGDRRRLRLRDALRLGRRATPVSAPLPPSTRSRSASSSCRSAL